MKKILTIVAVTLCAISAFCAPVQLGDEFTKIKVGENNIPGWSNQFVKNPDNGVASVIASPDGKQACFNIKTDKLATTFYREELTAVKPGEALICAVRASGKGKISIGCFGYSLNGRYFPLPGRQRTFTVSENGKLFRAHIIFSDKGRLPLGKIRPCFTIEKGSDITIHTLAFTYHPKEAEEAAK